MSEKKKTVKKSTSMSEQTGIALLCGVRQPAVSISSPLSFRTWKDLNGVFLLIYLYNFQTSSLIYSTLSEYSGF